jgi:hypothetical protein
MNLSLWEELSRHTANFGTPEVSDYGEFRFTTNTAGREAAYVYTHKNGAIRSVSYWLGASYHRDPKEGPAYTRYDDNGKEIYRKYAFSLSSKTAGTGS